MNPRIFFLPTWLVCLSVFLLTLLQENKKKIIFCCFSFHKKQTSNNQLSGQLSPANNNNDCPDAFEFRSLAGLCGRNVSNAQRDLFVSAFIRRFLHRLNSELEKAPISPIVVRSLCFPKLCLCSVYELPHYQ